MKHIIRSQMKSLFFKVRKKQNKHIIIFLVMMKRLIFKEGVKLIVKPFMPRLVYFEPKALEYPLGKQLFDKFEKMNLEIRYTTSHNQIRDLPGDNDFQKYRVAKSTLVVGVRKTLRFDTSKPSAEYAIPLATGCMGHCHYCYLQTTMGNKPYIRTYVNVEEILKLLINIWRSEHRK